METRMIDLRLMKQRIEELEVLENRVNSGQDVDELVSKMKLVCIRLKLHIDDYKESLLKEYS